MSMRPAGHISCQMALQTRLAAIVHMTKPTPISSTTQDRGRANMGASKRAPKPKAEKKLKEANPAAIPNANS